ncbi:MAG TPA: hypothetical protein VIF09_08865 [Polyangiaceae bacterium]|jgi:hypothetical protein
MVEPPGGIFPFGRPLLRRRPSAKSRRRVLVLGAYPGALHIAWWSPHRRLVRALAVDNEPGAFWAGEDERGEIEAWRAAVHFRVGEWGEVETAEENGKAGRWVDEHVLAPLGMTRDEACLSFCVDTYRADGGVARAIAERYQPFALEAGLPEARLEARPREGAFVELAVTMHGERLLKELSVVVPEIVVTLGGGPHRVLRAITEMKGGRRLRPDASYGVEQPLTVGGRKTRWLALCAPDPSTEYAEVHARWRDKQTR